MKMKQFENGLRVFFDKRNDLRSATVGVWVASGSKYENEKNNGISHFIEHIVFKASKNRSGFEIAESMDEIGASYNAYTTKEYTYFYVKALDYQIIKAADILFDLVKNPRLDEKDIETEKGVILEEIAMCEDDPADKCFEVNESSMYKGNGLSLEILGTKQTVSEMEKADFTDYLEKFYIPERIIIGVGGNFDEEEITKKIEEYFGEDENTRYKPESKALTYNYGISRVQKETEQTQISMSFEGVGIEHQDLYPLQILTYILGVGSSSMLGRRIREELGLVYSIDSFLVRFTEGGYINISMGLSPSFEEKAIRETLGIVSSFRERVTERQVSIAKEKLASSFIMSREQPQSRFSATGYTLLLLDKAITDDEIIERVKAVTFDDVKKAAEKYLRIDRMNFTAVGHVDREEKYRKIIDEYIKEGD